MQNWTQTMSPHTIEAAKTKSGQIQKRHGAWTEFLWNEMMRCKVVHATIMNIYPLERLPEQNTLWWAGTWYIQVHIKLVVSGRAARDLDHDAASRFGFQILQEQNDPTCSNLTINSYRLKSLKFVFVYQTLMEIHALEWRLEPDRSKFILS